MYIGWTYEIDATAEVIYTNADPTNWLVDHKWSWDNHPYISYAGRGGQRDFFTDFRFRKVLEASDKNTRHDIGVACSVRDVRFPQWDLRMSDDDIVGFLIEGVDYHPADLICISLRDVVMFESAGEFAMFYEVDTGKVAGGFSVRVYPDPSTSIMKVSDIVIGNAGTDFNTVSFAFENGKTKVYVDVDPYKFTNKWKGTDNEKLLRQAKDWTQNASGKAAIVFDDSISGGVLSPHDSSGDDGLRQLIDSAFGSLGSGWDIYNHSKLNKAQCENDPMWEQYPLVVYVDRFGTSNYPQLKHVLTRVRDGDCGLIVLGDGYNARSLIESSTTAEFNETTSVVKKQAIDADWGSDTTHPITAGVSIYSDQRTLRCIKEVRAISDISIKSEWNVFVADKEATKLEEVRFILHDNEIFQPKRRIYWVELKDTQGVSPNCGRHRAKIEIVDDEVQKDIDGSWGIGHDHFLDNQFMHESFKFRANTKYVWNNKLYTDLSAVGYRYGFSYPNCGDPREVDATLVVKNKSGEALIGTAFDQDFTLGGGSSAEFKAVGQRFEGAMESGSFGYVSLKSPHEQEWEMEFRYLDSAPCPGEPPMPIECGNVYPVKTKVRETLPINEDTTERCTDFFAYVHVHPCGDDRVVPVKFEFTSNEPQSCTLTITNRDGDSHSEILQGYGSKTVVDMQCRYPTEDTLFAPPDDLAWIASIALHGEDGEALPKVLGAVTVNDTEPCGQGGPGFTCPEATLPDGSEGFSWNVGDVMDGQWYTYDNQDDLCGQIYDGFTFSVSDLYMPWEHRDKYRYRVEIVFETRAAGEYQYVRRKRFSGGKDVDMWISNNVAETWTHEYILRNDDFNTAAADRFVERYSVSFRALDENARLTFKWKLRFNRERFDGTNWVPDNRAPYEGWAKEARSVGLTFETKPTTYVNKTFEYNILDKSIMMLNTHTPNQLPEKGTIAYDFSYEMNPQRVEKAMFYNYRNGAKELAWIKKMEAFRYDIKTARRYHDFTYSIPEADIAKAVSARLTTGRWTFTIETYTHTSMGWVGDGTLFRNSSQCTYLPYKHPEDKVPVATNQDEFAAKYPVTSTRMFGYTKRVTSQSPRSAGQYLVGGFYKLHLFVHERPNEALVYGNLKCKASYAGLNSPLIGVVCYDSSGSVIAKQVIPNTWSRYTTLSAKCDKVHSVDFYCINGSAFFEDSGTGKLLVEFSG